MIQTEARIGRYAVEAFVARGGMGDVYRVRSDAPFALSKTFAIKRIARGGEQSERARKAFADEARIGFGIDHPNVGKVIDLVDDRDGLYLVMEWIDGHALSRLLGARDDR